MKVGLVSACAPQSDLPVRSLLALSGPLAVLGWTGDELAAPIVPSASTLFGPRGVCWLRDGSFWVADTGHHRVLGWRTTPGADNVPADIVLGQAGFADEGRNAKAAPGPASLNVPTGIAAWGEGLAVADAWNHRVLLWRSAPSGPDCPADIILGQDNAEETLSNRGRDRPEASSMHWPYGVAVIGNRLVVCDTGNRRVLIWDDPCRTGQAADLVLGQSDFVTRDENAGGEICLASMRWPHSAVASGSGLAIADAGNNRVMLWESWPDRAGIACQTVLGQADGRGCDHNRGAYYPSASTLNMPYALGVAGDSLLIADTANSRILGWPRGELAADRLCGQINFVSKGDNRWNLPERDSLCWPYGLAVRDELVAIADSGNNRILLWSLSDAG